MRTETDREKLQRFMVELGKLPGATGNVYFTGGATAVDWPSCLRRLSRFCRVLESRRHRR